MLQRGMLKSSVASALAIVLLCLVMLRSLRQMLISQVPLIYGVALTLAFVRLAYSNLNLITSSFVAVLLGLGIDFAVHVIYRFNEERRAGAENRTPRSRLRWSTGPAIVLGALVTAARVRLDPADRVHRLRGARAHHGVRPGVHGHELAAGAAGAAGPPGRARHRRREEGAAGLRALTAFVRRFRVPLLVLGLARRRGRRGRPAADRLQLALLRLLAPSTESAQALDVLEADPLMSPVYANVTAPDIATAQAMASKLRALPEVGGVQTATDMLPVLDEPRLAALRGGLAALDRAPDFASWRRSGPRRSCWRRSSRRSSTRSTRSASAWSRAGCRPPTSRRRSSGSRGSGSG
jgi:hypothetical protein